MAINIKLGDPNQNSYITATQADTYFTNRRNTAEWDNLTATQKTQLLVQAARDFEAFNFNGDLYYSSQGLSFPRDDHEIVEGDCGTPFTLTSFRNSDLYSDTYGEIPTNYWTDGTVHITAGPASLDTRVITLSDPLTGSITVGSNFSASPDSTSDFIVFAPVDKKVADAQCEQALFVLKNANIETIQNYKMLGAEAVRFGDVNIRFKRGSVTKMSISPAAKKLLSRWLRTSIRLARA